MTLAGSPLVNGLQARLSLARGQALNGTALITTYLELRNVANIANVMKVPLKLDAIQFEVVDDRDKPVAPTSLPYDEFSVELGMLRLPHDSYLRFNISHQGAGVPKTSLVCLTLVSSIFGCSVLVINARITCADDSPSSRVKTQLGRERFRYRKSKSQLQNRCRQQGFLQTKSLSPGKQRHAEVESVVRLAGQVGRPNRTFRSNTHSAETRS
jgi:hypothetical protein